MARSRAIETKDVRVERLVSGGAGLVHVGGRARFIDRVLPGELVRASWDGGGKLASLVVLEPSPLRRAPPCAYASACGGCDWLHVPDDEQPRLHAELVAPLLARAMGADVPLEMRPASAPLRYRTRARLRFEVTGARAALGFLAEGTHRLAPIDDCAVLDEALFAAARAFVRCAAESRPKALFGELSIAWGRSDGRALPVLDVHFDSEPDGALVGALDELARTHLAGARATLPGAGVPLRFGDPRPVQRGADGAPLVLAAGGFAQPSDDGAIALARAVHELAAPEGKAVLELFAGSGTFSVLLAKDAASFASVELARDAVTCARENLAARGLEGRLSEGDANAATIPKSADVVVLDPPRQGARAAAAAIAKAKTRAVVYVSCEPTTLARDLATFKDAGYACDRAIGLSLFPQTSHVEVVVALRRMRGRA